MAKKEKGGIVISGCHIENSTPPHNEHTRACIESLARAAEQNAAAIKAIAEALADSGAYMTHGIHVAAA